eukprot:4329870-Prymnesium_polylepis.1
MGGPSRTPSIAPRSVPTSSLHGGPGCSSDSPNSSAGAFWRGRRGHTYIDRTGGLAHFHCNRPWM